MNQRRNILIIDDDDDLLTLWCIKLNRLGYNVITATNCDDAIGLYNQAFTSEDPVHAVIVDLVIPGSLGGKDIATKILNINPAAQIIVSSGNTQAPEMVQYQDFGFCSAIDKTLNLENTKLTLQKIFEDNAPLKCEP